MIIFLHFSKIKKTESSLNGDATPFVPSESGDSASADQSYGTFQLKIPLDSKIWRSISARSPHSHRLNGTLPSAGAATSTSMLGTKNPMHSYQPWNIFPDLCMSRTLTTDVSANGLISIRRLTDNIL